MKASKGLSTKDQDVCRTPRSIRKQASVLYLDEGKQRGMREMHSGVLLAHAVRLEPGDDLVPCLLRAAHLAAGASTTTNDTTRSSSSVAAHPRRPAATSSVSCVVLTVVGSLSSLTVRLANASAHSSSSPTTTGTTTDPKSGDAVTAASTTLRPDPPTGSLHEESHHSLSVQPANPLPSPASSDASCFRTWNECLEVTSLVGTFAFPDIDSTAASNEEDSYVAKHLHITVSDGRGQAFGGHLVSGVVHTTLELVLGSIEGVAFRREHDPRTGYGELVVNGLTSGLPPTSNPS